MPDVPNYTEQDERAAKIANLEADTMLKIEQAKWEPWKVVAASLAAGAGIMGAAVALVGAVAAVLLRL